MNLKKKTYVLSFYLKMALVEGLQRHLLNEPGVIKKLFLSMVHGIDGSQKDLKT